MVHKHFLIYHIHGIQDDIIMNKIVPHDDL